MSDTDSFFEPALQMTAIWAQLWATMLRGAPNQLTQPILPDWSLIRIDETNSTSPATERAVVAKESYGRQIGRMMDALAALIDLQPVPAGGKPEAFVEFEKIKKSVDDIKTDTAFGRIKHLNDDLARLKQMDQTRYDEAMKLVRAASQG